MIRAMNGSPLAKSGGEAPLVRGRLVIFRPRGRIAVPAAWRLARDEDGDDREGSMRERSTP